MPERILEADLDLLAHLAIRRERQLTLGLGSQSSAVIGTIAEVSRNPTRHWYRRPDEPGPKNDDREFRCIEVESEPFRRSLAE